MSEASVIAVIPARYGSSRLPGKALADIAGVPMIVRVWRQASKAQLLKRVLIATDDERIASAVRAAGGEVEMTASSHQSGTDRIAEVARRVPADIYLNVQGDQPFIAPQDVDAVARAMADDATLAMATLGTPISTAEEWCNPNKVKIVCDNHGNALYFSRSPIPFWRDGVGVPPNALRHVAVYGYRRQFLLDFAALEPGTLEQIEKLEQLRAMEHGYRIRVVASVAPSLEVDTPEDLAQADAAARR
ncbi:MAG TPA: 3-deoxy-manno-octulosonate cytidylyltransferase [Candidatus Binataceae bacterium]|nr:3-deoxy-manno-octulosonate cytidylyltransferase [Candidatus Binataceae bacterium]